MVYLMNMLTNLVYRYGLFAVFFLIMIEYACFPVSSEIVLPFSGAVASVQEINFILLLPVSILAGLIGTSVCYFIGKIGGEALIEKIIRRFPKTQKAVEDSYEKFNKFGLLAVCLGRLIPLCRTYIAFVAGALGLNYLKFLFASSIGITIWNTVLLGIGYLFHENWSNISYYYKDYKQVILLFLLFVFLIWYLKKIVFKKPKLGKE